MADYSKSQLVRRVAESPFFAIQLDESTDVTNFSQLLVYVRYVYDFEMIEDFLFCKPLEGRTTGVEIFKVLNDFPPTQQRLHMTRMMFFFFLFHFPSFISFLFLFIFWFLLKRCCNHAHLFLKIFFFS